MKTSPGKLIVIGLLHVYQWTISPILHFLSGPGSGCRYHPSCSVYAIEAVKIHGCVKGLWLSTRRILRCHPWGGEGHDPVPPPKTSSDVVKNRIRK